MNSLLVTYSSRDIEIVAGLILLISGIYQFSSLKRKCLGYCESPLAFFMKRWKGNRVRSGLQWVSIMDYIVLDAAGPTSFL